MLTFEYSKTAAIDKSSKGINWPNIRLRYIGLYMFNSWVPLCRIIMVFTAIKSRYISSPQYGNLVH